MILFKKIRYMNFLSTGNSFTEILLNKSKSTLIVGKNGAGKCVHPLTEVEIDFADDEQLKALFEQFDE